MKILMTVAFAMGCTISLQAQKMNSTDVPANVKASLQKAYAGKNVSWDKEDDNYEASFKQKDQETSIVLDASGTILETEVEISKKDLPAPILDALKKGYADYKIEEAAKIESPNGAITYEAEVEKGEKSFDLIFDATGKLLKTEAKEEKEKEDKD